MKSLFSCLILKRKERTLKELHIVTDLLKALLSNGSINTQRPNKSNNRRGLLFPAVHAATVPTQWVGKHLNNREPVFSVWSMPHLYSEIPRITSSVDEKGTQCLGL
jgi:hypothetical protein